MKNKNGFGYENQFFNRNRSYNAFCFWLGRNSGLVRNRGKHDCD